MLEKLKLESEKISKLLDVPSQINVNRDELLENRSTRVFGAAKESENTIGFANEDLIQVQFFGLLCISFRIKGMR